MAFTKQYAKILAGMLAGDDLKAFRVICGKDDNVSDISEETISELISLELIRRDTDGKRQLVLLTSKGKKVAEFV